MHFVYFTQSELEKASISWCDDVEKEPELIDAATAAGFSLKEATESPMGILTEDFAPVPNMHFLKGSRALAGTNGCVLIESSNG
jgi:hypothetical protein